MAKSQSLRVAALAALAVLGASAPSVADTYYFRSMSSVSAPHAAPEVPAGPRRYAVADMGIATKGLRDAVAAGAGTQADWIRCTFGSASGDEPCDGARQVLVLITATGTGKQYGLLARTDITTLSTNADMGGFYFSDAIPAKGWVFDRTGVNTTTGTISTSRAFSHPIYFLFGASATGYASNGDWKTGFTLTGDASGTPVPGTPVWYKR